MNKLCNLLGHKVRRVRDEDGSLYLFFWNAPVECIRCKEQGYRLSETFNSRMLLKKFKADINLCKLIGHKLKKSTPGEVVGRCWRCYGLFYHHNKAEYVVENR